MKKTDYRRLEQDFGEICRLFSGGLYDEALFNQTAEDIKALREKICKSKSEEKRLLLYCIDTLFEIIGENMTGKTYDFACTIQNMPQIAMGQRNVYSFDREILAFQRKYGKKYFPDFQKAKPKFQKKAPKNKWEFFSKASDDSFKRLHPVGYWVLCAIGIFALMLPVSAFVVYVEYINPSDNDGVILLGFVGAFTVGIGLFNIVAAWIHQYLGHFLTIFCIFAGSAITALSLFLLYG